MSYLWLAGFVLIFWALLVRDSLEIINGDGIVEDYLIRHTLLKVPGCFTVYWHHFTHDDWSIDLHDHPKGFISIGVWGEYVEETLRTYNIGTPYERSLKHYEHFRAPWIRWFPPEHQHRLMMVPIQRTPGERPRPCWTICIVGTARRDWGWWMPVPGTGWRTWVDWHSYMHIDVRYSRRAR